VEEGTGTFFDLYNAIIDEEREEDIVKQEVIKLYYNFGKVLDECFNEYRKENPKRTTQALVNKEV
jgi:hypothetical protein